MLHHTRGRRPTRRWLLSLATVCALALLAPAAQAGTPFTVGAGQDPHVLVDESGTAHVAWVEPGAFKVLYCQVPAQASGCAGQIHQLQWPDTSQTYMEPSAPYVLRSGSTLYVAMSHWILQRQYVWQSGDGGATWSARRVVYSGQLARQTSEPVLGPQVGELTFAGWDPDAAVIGAGLSGAEGGNTAPIAQTAGGHLIRDFAAVPAPGGGLLAAGHGGSSAYAWRLGPGADPSLAANWSAPVPVGPGSESRLAGGAGGAYLLATDPAGVRVHRWDGNGFGAPVTIATEQVHFPDIDVTPNGTVMATFRRNGNPDLLTLAISRDGGASWAVSTIVREERLFAGQNASVTDGGTGFSAWSDDGVVRMANMDPAPEPPPAAPPAPAAPASPAPAPLPSYNGKTRSKKVSDSNGTYSFVVPGQCVRPGQRFNVTLTWKRKKKKGNKWVKIRRADFYIASKRVKIDKKAPFRQTLTVTAGTKPGSSIALRARAFIKVSRGKKTPKKSIRTKIKVC